ncbi:MAG: hypothetical protein A2156_03565 [Deltaproteobacteria bacterium RBG_16_48_10]|nr:MAG: hypothetical protein A2156_03565 [Deltaproteobacteria bacterium RBG_16_48_10]
MLKSFGRNSISMKIASKNPKKLVPLPASNNSASPPPPREWEEKAIRHTILLSISVLLSQFSLFLRGFIAAKFLGPSLYGLWHGLRVIINNSEYSCMGLYEGMRREVPFYRGKGDSRKAVEMVATSFFSALGLVSLVSFLLIVISALFSPRLDPSTLYCLWIVAGVLIARQLCLFFIKKFESEGRFFSRSKMDLISVWLGVILSLGLMLLFRLHGFLIGILLGYLFAFLVTFKGESPIEKSDFRLETGIELMKVGLPIILIGLMLSVLRSLDKLNLLYFLDRTQLGYYGIALVATDPILLFPRNLKSVLYPRLLETYGEKGDKRYLKGFLFEPSLILVFSTLLLIGAIYCIVPTGVRIFLPLYTLSIPSIKILAIGSYFAALSEIPLSILIGINLQKKLIPFLLGAIALLGISCSAALSLGYGIEAVAVSSSFTHFLLTSTILWLTATQFHQSTREKIRLFSSIYLPLLYVLTVLLLLDFGIGIPEQGFSQMLLVTALRFLIFLSSLIPIFFYVNRRTHIIDRFLKAFRVKDGITRGAFLED